MRLSRVQFNTPLGPPVDRRFSDAIHQSLERGVGSRCSTAAGVANYSVSTSHSDWQTPVVRQAIDFAAPSAVVDHYYCDYDASSSTNFPVTASAHGADIGANGLSLRGSADAEGCSWPVCRLTMVIY